VIVLLIAYVLVIGLSAGVVTRGRDALVSVFTTPPPQPRQEEKKRPVVRPTSGGAKGDPAPPNLKNQATQVFAPKLPPIIVPPPVPVATQPALGNAASTGNADIAGPGQGAGDLGDGTGGGGQGGSGAGDGGIAQGPRQTKGKLSRDDLPKDLLPPGVEAHVGVRFTVDVDGRVRGCQADQPSGYPELDSLVCRLTEERYRYRPARDAAGRPVPVLVLDGHRWRSKSEKRGNYP
jgi:periplasmic protein TonB